MTDKWGEKTSEFFDRIHSHFSSIKVNNYRCLKGAEVNNLSRINLFAGLNNSGKTSFLEAVYLLCRQNDVTGVIDVLRLRGKIPENHIPSKWLSDQLNEEMMVEGIFDNKICSVKILSYQEENTTLDPVRYLKSVEILSQFDTCRLKSLTQLFQGRDPKTQASTIKLLSKNVFSTPFLLNEPHHYMDLYQRSVQSNLLSRICQFIREKMVPTIQDIRLADDSQRFLVEDDHFIQSMDLTSYGEGLQRIFFTSLLFSSAENGIVLIDEFENAIHAELIATFAPFVHLLAKEFNVQVFLTTHSKECIDAFVKKIPPEDITDFAFHALVRKENEMISVREFAGKEFSKLLLAGDVDLRRAQ